MHAARCTIASALCASLLAAAAARAATITTLAKSGNALPSPLSGTYNAFFDPHVNDSGSIVFRATMNAASSDLGLLFFNGTVFSTIVTKPTATVRFPPDINSAGDVVYKSAI